MFHSEQSPSRRLDDLYLRVRNRVNWIITKLTGNSPLSLPNAVAKPIKSLTQYGLCTQAGTPTLADPVDIMCNNGTLKWDSVNQRVYADGTAEVLWVGDGNKLPPNAVADVRYPVSGSGSYIVSCDVNNGTNVLAVEVHYYKADGTQINYYTLSSYDDTTHRMYKSFSLPNTAAYVSIERKAAYSTATVTDLKLEMGSTLTPYVQPTGVASVQNLFGVGDYADTQEILSGAVGRQIGVKVLDGTEDWRKQSGSYRYYITISDASTDNAYIPICTHFKGASGSTAWTNINDGEFKHASGVNTFYFQNDACADSTEFAAWLAAQYAAGTPVIVVYPLAEATTESVAGQSLSTAAGTNVVSVTANVSPIQLEVEYAAKRV